MSRRTAFKKKNLQVNRRRNLLIFASVASITLLAIVAVIFVNRVPDIAATAPQQSSIAVGDKAPDFSVVGTNGAFRLSRDGASRPTVLEVFATWCPHCQHESPLISKLAEHYGSKVTFIGVVGSPTGYDGESPESQADVNDWMHKYHATYDIAFDPSLDVANKYLQSGYPSIALIQSGVVKALRSGEIPADDIKAGVDALLAGKNPDPKLGQNTP